MILDKFKLDGKVAIVTGAGRGIGAGIALGFGEAGAHVVCSARTLSQVEAVADKIRGFGQTALAISCDVLKKDSREGLVNKTLDKFGRIDILVNNAGGAPYSPALLTSDEDFEWAMKFNVTVPFSLIKLVAPHMLKTGGGVILNISTAMSRVTDRGFVAYGSSKAALSHMTRLLGNELAPKIRVNAIAPGAILTSALAPFVEDKKMHDGLVGKTPLRRLGNVTDIAAAAIFLCSEAGSFVTGKIYEVDGGIETSNFPVTLPDL